jgi:hypothetical protein
MWARYDKIKQASIVVALDTPTKKQSFDLAQIAWVNRTAKPARKF